MFDIHSNLARYRDYSIPQVGLLWGMLLIDFVLLPSSNMIALCAMVLQLPSSCCYCSQAWYYYLQAWNCCTQVRYYFPETGYYYLQAWNCTQVRYYFPETGYYYLQAWNYCTQVRYYFPETGYYYLQAWNYCTQVRYYFPETGYYYYWPQYG